MQPKFAIALLLLGGCKIHRIPEVPPEQDPAAEQGAALPYRAPPDVLTTELSTGEPTAGGHEGHDMSGHEGHDMSGHDMKSSDGKKTKKKTDAEHEHHHGSEP